MLKTTVSDRFQRRLAYHLGEGRVLKTPDMNDRYLDEAYHLGEGRVLKTPLACAPRDPAAYHLGEGRVLKTR